MTGESDFSKLLQQNLWEREKELSEARARRDAETFEAPVFLVADAESYARCLHPEGALASLGLSSKGLAVTQLHREIRSARVQVIAHEAIWALDGTVISLSYPVIDAWYWHLSVPDEASDFWETGYFSASIPTTKGKSKFRGTVEIYGGRFWPDNLPGGEGNPRPGQASAKDTRPPVPDADLRRWHEVFSQVHQHSTEEAALRSAQAMFPDNHVSRQKVRDLRGPQKRGRPGDR
ncbi:hypothetical protein [Parerythrobacter lacustris]|uniref:Uncharacterized protein n=1 Tax=Parerythrobacter lacustris TaxID=2969984 RepID=A0ABT1XPY3_9SPHN|nr:hypothetical protein [Parerythrobacter lacustris]MCR2833309.1 hypothetical protein [Parerythrobacter lacustris]